MSKNKDLRMAGVDIGGTKLYAIIADGRGKVHGRARKKVGGDHGFDSVVQRVDKLVRKACREAGLELAQLAAVGVGAPSPILPDGTAVRAPNLGWQSVPLTPALSQALGRPVFAENDCNAGTLGEYTFGAGRGARTLVGLFMGTGLGGGVVLDGRVVTGDNHQAAELGHMIVVVGGRRCGCGHRGCLEAYASKTGMSRRITHQVLCEGRQTLLTELCDGDYRRLRGGILARAYAADDAVTVETLHEAADYLGHGVGNLITMLGPDRVLLGGGVMEALGEQLLPRVCAAAASVTHPPSSFADTRIGLASLGDDAVALGAVAHAMRELSR